MKIKRYKKVNKSIGFYVNNFGFRQPYQLLVDGTFCFAALNNKINIADNIPTYLQGEVKLLTTQCAIMEMENLGPKLYGASLILKKFAVHKCGHEGKPIVASKCMLSMLAKKNEKHYIIATQDRELQEKVRNVPAAPLLYLHTKTPILEQPSQVSVDLANNKLLGITEYERKTLDDLKEKSGLVTQPEKSKRRKKKGPNPLSCKKKRKLISTNPISKKESVSDVEKRRRKKVRIPKHVKDELIKNKSTC